jgi:hypothetical protein
MLQRTPFRFRGCLLNIATKESRKASFAIPPSVDDNALLEFFNTPHKPVSGTSTGLFRHKQITSPDAFIPVAMATMARANYVVRRIINARKEHGTVKIVKNIDRLSDLLCGIIDMAELVRHTHPEKAWVDAANNTYDILCEYMNELNTNTELAGVCLALTGHNALILQFLRPLTGLSRHLVSVYCRPKLDKQLSYSITTFKSREFIYQMSSARSSFSSLQISSHMDATSCRASQPRNHQ